MYKNFEIYVFEVVNDSVIINNKLAIARKIYLGLSISQRILKTMKNQIITKERFGMFKEIVSNQLF